MAAPDENPLLWEWELAATQTCQTRGGPITDEAWVAQRPEGWYAVADLACPPQDPDASYQEAATQAAALLGPSRLRRRRPSA